MYHTISFNFTDRYIYAGVQYVSENDMQLLFCNFIKISMIYSFWVYIKRCKFLLKCIIHGCFFLFGANILALIRK